jgi:D-alanyl-D-alanine carboxypeptidase
MVRHAKNSYTSRMNCSIDSAESSSRNSVVPPGLFQATPTHRMKRLTSKTRASCIAFIQLRFVPRSLPAILAGLALMLSACSTPTVSAPPTHEGEPPDMDLTGNWLVTLTSPSGISVEDISLNFVQNGSQLTGTWQNPQVPETRMVSGRLSGLDLQFSFPYKEGDETRSVEVLAQVKGDEITGVADFKDQAGRTVATFQLASQRAEIPVAAAPTATTEHQVRSEPLSPEEARDLLQAELDRLRQEDDFPGAVASVVTSGEPAVTVATGLADKEYDVHMTTDARMPTGSVGKTFVAALVLKLTDDGVLELDAPISQWLDDRPWFSRLPNAKDITIRMLLNHSSGIPDYVGDPRFIEDVRSQATSANPDLNSAYTPEELIGYVLDQPPLFPAGHGYAYSDTGYILLGLVIEKATGVSYYALLQDQFLTPLNLANTVPADRRDLAGIVPGYLPADNQLGLPTKAVEDGELVFNPTSEWTGGGLISNAADLARWASLLYQGEAMRAPYLEEMLNSVSEGNAQYGLGVSISKTALGVSYGHAGEFPGYRTDIAYFPEYDLAIAIQVNTEAGVDPGRYIIDLAKSLVFQS